MSRLLTMSLVAAAVALVGCEASAPKMGSESAKTTATGSAGGASAQNVNSKLGRCDRPAGTIALVEDTSLDWYRAYLDKYRLGSTTPVLRLLIQQSNCFIVVERGRAMANMQQERALQNSGELRNNSNFGKGQMVSADYSLTPEVLISARGTSGLGAGLAGMGGRLGLLGAVAGGIQTNEAAVMLTLVDNRSGVQVAAAEGSSSNTDFSLGAVLVGSSGVGGAGGYTNTPQGKVVSAAFTDAYNNIINAVKNYSPQSMGDRGMGTGGVWRLKVHRNPRVRRWPQAPQQAQPAQRCRCATRRPSSTSSATTLARPMGNSASVRWIRFARSSVIVA